MPEAVPGCQVFLASNGERALRGTFLKWGSMRKPGLGTTPGEPRICKTAGKLIYCSLFRARQGRDPFGIASQPETLQVRFRHYRKGAGVQLGRMGAG